MKFAIATVCLSGDFREKLTAIARAGFGGVEIFEQDFIAFDGGPREARKMIEDLGLEVILFQPFRDFEGLPEPHRARAFDRAERKFDVMEELGADQILMVSSVHPLSTPDKDRIAADFVELGDRAAARGMRIGYEALAWGTHIWDHRDAWDVVRRANHDAVGIVLDSYHTLARGIDPDSIREIPGEKIFVVQVADAPKIDMDVMYLSRHFRNMPGQGNFDVERFVSAAASTGFTGPWSLEVFNDQFRRGSPEAIAVDGHRSLANILDRVRRDEPALPIIAPKMPPRATIKGMEFIEFAAGNSGLDELSGVLKSMGFTPEVTHKTKDITLWREGGVNIVINPEAHSAEVSYPGQTGPSVSAICLRVDNARAAVGRALALGAEEAAHPEGDVWAGIPAIRAFGGSVIYFVDDDTDLSANPDFPFPKSGEAPHPAGLLHFDHFAQAMNADELLTWALYYTSIFDLRKTPLFDIADPNGLISSRSIENSDGAFRITLNGVDSSRTFSGHFLSDSFGASVQHIAIGTDDILATAKTIEESGFHPLPVTDNYYDDLAARFGLPEDELAKLKAASIMYDEDENGGFFQLYSMPLAGGFFFEIVERRPGYAGYGAPNAPYRIASQKRILAKNQANGG